MDWFRAVLILAIGVLGWNLVYQWNQDYGQGRTVEPTKQTTEYAKSNDISTASLAPNQNQPDKLDTGLIPNKQENPKLANDQTIEPSQLISVETPLYRAKIDLRGGDLIELALRRYPDSVDQPDQPFEMLVKTEQRKFVAESGIIGKNATDLDAASARPMYRAQASTYTLAANQKKLVVPLQYINKQGVEFEKRLVFYPEQYKVDVQFEVQNLSNSSWLGRPYGRLRRTGYADPSEGGGFGLPTFLGVAYWDPEDRFTKVDFGDIDDVDAGQLALKKEVEGGWIAILQHYFVAAWAPNSEQTNLYRASYNDDANLPGGREYVVDSVLPQINIAPSESHTFEQTLYIGPKLQEQLKTVASGLNLVVDYGPLFFISDALIWVLEKIYSVVHNYGVAIILLTVLVKLLLFPISAKGYKSMARMRTMQPKMAELRKRFGEDRQKMSEELMKLYKREGVNPLGGCLPMLVQMPVFLALYWALLESVQLRQAPFVLWIEDLSIMDPYFALPVLMGVSMWFQQKLNPSPPDPMQAQILRYMPIAMTFLFLFFPAGLVLYWLTNNVLSIAQQAFITKRMLAPTSTPAANNE